MGPDKSSQISSSALIDLIWIFKSGIAAHSVMQRTDADPHPFRKRGGEGEGLAAAESKTNGLAPVQLLMQKVESTNPVNSMRTVEILDARGVV